MADEWNMRMEHWWNDTEREERKYSEKILSHNFSTKNPIRTSLLATPSLHPYRPVFNPLAPEFPFKFQHTLYLKCE